MEKPFGATFIKCRVCPFREVPTDSGPWFVAWFEPDHFIVEANTKFFVDRFTSMRWSILTPDRCAHWDKEKLWFTEGVAKSEAPAEDAKENLWLTYYSNIFNPARVKVKAMQKESQILKNFRSHVIGRVSRAAPHGTHDRKAIRRVAKAHSTRTARTGLELLHDAAKTCRACQL